MLSDLGSIIILVGNECNMQAISITLDHMPYSNSSTNRDEPLSIKAQLSNYSVLVVNNTKSVT